MSLVIEEGIPIPRGKKTTKWDDLVAAFGRIDNGKQSIFIPDGYAGYTDRKKLRVNAFNALHSRFKERAKVIVYAVDDGVRVWKG